MRVSPGDIEITQSVPSSSSWSARETNRNTILYRTTVVEHYLLPDNTSVLGFQDTAQFACLSTYLFGLPSQSGLLLLLVSSKFEF